MHGYKREYISRSDGGNSNHDCITRSSHVRRGYGEESHRQINRQIDRQIAEQIDGQIDRRIYQSMQRNIYDTMSPEPIPGNSLHSKSPELESGYNSRFPDPGHGNTYNTRSPDSGHGNTYNTRSPDPEHGSTYNTRSPDPGHGNTSNTRSPDPGYGSTYNTRSPDPRHGSTYNTRSPGVLSGYSPTYHVSTPGYANHPPPVLDKMHNTRYQHPAVDNMHNPICSETRQRSTARLVQDNRCGPRWKDTDYQGYYFKSQQPRHSTSRPDTNHRDLRSEDDQSQQPRHSTSQPNTNHRDLRSEDDQSQQPRHSTSQPNTNHRDLRSEDDQSQQPRHSTSQPNTNHRDLRSEDDQSQQPRHSTSQPDINHCEEHDMPPSPHGRDSKSGNYATGVSSDIGNVEDESESRSSDLDVRQPGKTHRYATSGPIISSSISESTSSFPVRVDRYGANQRERGSHSSDSGEIEGAAYELEHDAYIRMITDIMRDPEQIRTYLSAMRLACLDEGEHQPMLDQATMYGSDCPCATSAPPEPSSTTSTSHRAKALEATGLPPTESNTTTIATSHMAKALEATGLPPTESNTTTITTSHMAKALEATGLFYGYTLNRANICCRS